VSRKNIRPVALTIAGSDSGGEAGIQADLKTFFALGIHGTSAITCVTAQNPKVVSQIEPCSVAMIRAQVMAVFSELHPLAAKTGMLYSAAIVRAVVSVLKRQRRIPLVVDPVMVSTSGKILLKPDALRLVRNELLPMATLVTPNLAEAAVLTGKKIATLEDMRSAARQIATLFGCAALVKGGHLRGSNEAVDFLSNGREEWMFSAPYIQGLKTHGTGCTYSAAITAGLALGMDLVQAVELGKNHITHVLCSGV